MSDLPYIDDAVSIKKKIEYMKGSNDFNSVNVDWLVRTVEYQQQEIERLNKDYSNVNYLIGELMAQRDKAQKEVERLRKHEATLDKIAQRWIEIETGGTMCDADDFYSDVQDILEVHEKTL